MAAKGIGAVPTVVDDAADHGEELDVEEERAWMKCVRLLMLNDPTRLLEFQRVVVTIMTKILDHPSDPKYRTLKTSNKTVKNKVLNTSGGAEFLLASGFILKREKEGSCAIGSAPVHINGQDNDSSKIFYLPATVMSSIKDTLKGKSNNSSNQPKEPEESTINEDMVEKLTTGVEWLSSNVKILESFYESLSSDNSPAGTQSNKLCCECTIQVQLPTGQTVYGGFMRGDTLLDVQQYASCYFHIDRASSVRVILPDVASTASSSSVGTLAIMRQSCPSRGKEEGALLQCTLEELHLCPRAKVVATSRTSQEQETVFSRVYTRGVLETAQRRQVIVKEKMNKSDKRKLLQEEREKILAAFKDDRQVP